MRILLCLAHVGIVARGGHERLPVRVPAWDRVVTQGVVRRVRGAELDIEINGGPGGALRYADVTVCANR